MSNHVQALPGKKILVIEDSAENMRLFAAVLKLEGAEVIEAPSAPEGIKLAQQEQPDLIVMDIMMPEMDGLEATRILRSDPKTGNIPIVSVTASVMEKDKDILKTVRFDACVEKPIEPAEFAVILRQCLQAVEEE